MPILLVDDNDDFLDAVRAEMNDKDHDHGDAVFATSLAQARDAALQSSFSRIIVDYEFDASTQENGVDFLEECRRLLPEVELVLLTGRHVNAEARQRLHTMGAEVVAKSVLTREKLSELLITREGTAAPPAYWRHLYSDPVQESSSDDTAIAHASEDSWQAFITRLAREPQALHSLDPRRFEELIAELLERDGAIVTLTAASKDGGRDVLAFYDTPVGRHLYYVECKRYAPERPVGVALVRALYGVVQSDRATAGLLVTTSRFTSGALLFARALENQISLREYSDLALWLGRHASS